MPDTYYSDCLSVGRILMLKFFKNMKDSGEDLNTLPYDEYIEMVYRNIENIEYFPRKTIFDKNRKLEQDDYSQATAEEFK